jgi:hypothetical protein
VERTWKPKAAGIFCIIVGALFVVPGIVFLTPSDPMAFFTDPSYMVLVLVVIAPGIMPIVGGISALRRRKWRLALSGSILTLLGSVILGIYGIIISLGAVADNSDVTLSDATALAIGIIVCVTVSGILGLLALILLIRGKREFR